MTSTDGEEGIDVFGIFDKDRDPPADERLNERFHQLPVTCIENILLDHEAIYKALSESLVGPRGLEEKDIESEDDMENLMIKILSDPMFFRLEMNKRLNEELYIL